MLVHSAYSIRFRQRLEREREREMVHRISGLYLSLSRSNHSLGGGFRGNGYGVSTRVGSRLIVCVLINAHRSTYFGARSRQGLSY